MATSRKRNVEIDVVVDDAKARAKLKNIGDGAGQVGGQFQKMGTLAASAGALIAGSQIVDFLGDATAAAMEDEKSQRMLALALENTHKATQGEVASTEELIDSLSRSSGIADDELRPAMAELARTHGSVAEAQAALNIAMDISAAKGISLETVTKAMGKAALGNVGALGRLGVATKDAAGETMSYDEVLKEAERTMGGAFLEAAATAEGQMRKARVAFDEAKESLGRALLPAANEASGALSDLATIADELIQITTDLGGEGGAVPKLANATARSIPIIGGLVSGWDAARRVWGMAADALRGTEAAEKKVTSATADLSRQMDVNRHRTKAAADATRDLTDSYQEAADPAFALFRSTQRVREAQVAYTNAVINYGQKSPQATQAALDLAEAQGDLQGASARFAEQGGPQSINALRELARRAGLSESAIRDLINEIERLNRTPVGRRRSNIPDGPGGIIEGTSFASGGIVQGTPGQAVPIIAHAGEEVVSRSGRGATSGDGPIIVNLVVDGRVLAEVVTKHQVRDQRRNGTTGIR